MSCVEDIIGVFFRFFLQCADTFSAGSVMIQTQLVVSLLSESMPEHSLKPHPVPPLPHRQPSHGAVVKAALDHLPMLGVQPHPLPCHLPAETHHHMSVQYL